MDAYLITSYMKSQTNQTEFLTIYAPSKITVHCSMTTNRLWGETTAYLRTIDYGTGHGVLLVWGAEYYAGRIRRACRIHLVHITLHGRLIAHKYSGLTEIVIDTYEVSYK